MLYTRKNGHPRLFPTLRTSLTRSHTRNRTCAEIRSKIAPQPWSRPDSTLSIDSEKSYNCTPTCGRYIVLHSSSFGCGYLILQRRTQWAEQRAARGGDMSHQCKQRSMHVRKQLRQEGDIPTRPHPRPKRIPRMQSQDPDTDFSLQCSASYHARVICPEKS